MVDRRPPSSPDEPGSPPPTASGAGSGGSCAARGSGGSGAAGDAGAGTPGDRVMRAIQNFSRSPARAELGRSLYRTGDKELTPTQVDALETLVSRSEWHMHAFAGALGINPGAASRTTDRLIRLGLAERRPDESDRRYVVVRATASGRRISDRIRRDRHALMQEVLKDLTAGQRATLADLLDHVTRAMDAIVNRAPEQPGR